MQLHTHKLLQPDPSLIQPREHPPTHDRAPEELAEGTPQWIKEDLVALIGEEQVLSRTIDLIRFASDASPYRMFPQVVVLPRNEEEVQKIFKYATESGQTVTIRSAGSSLSGQSQGDGILLESKRHWAGWTVEDGGRRLRVRPGTVMFRANLALAPYGYRLGPDPASSGVCIAGLPLWIPDDLAGNCCATVWHSKGYVDGNTFMANKVVESMWKWSDEGQLPVVCDASSCSFDITSEILDYLTPENKARHAKMTILDSVAWAHDYLLPRLTPTRKVDSVAVHPVCATKHLGLADKLHALGAALSETAVTPIHSTCCAFAGDRGFLHPELTHSATSEEVKELEDRQFDQYLSSNRTCEVGMNLATGQDYRSVIFLLEELTR